MKNSWKIILFIILITIAIAPGTEALTYVSNFSIGYNTTYYEAPFSIPGEEYVLTNNITIPDTYYPIPPLTENDTLTGIVSGSIPIAQNVTIDCKGHKITIKNSLTLKGGILITNCTIAPLIQTNGAFQDIFNGTIDIRVYIYNGPGNPYTLASYTSSFPPGNNNTIDNNYLIKRGLDTEFYLRYDTITNNIIDGELYWGSGDITSSKNLTFTNNTFINAPQYGGIRGTNYTIKNNIFNGTPRNFFYYTPSATITNNYWINASNGGYSNTCADLDNDSICDNPYTFNAYKSGETVTDTAPLAIFCAANWTCTDYTACNINNTKSCTSVTDQNSCGTNYTGNYTEFTIQNCTYQPASNGGGGGGFPEENKTPLLEIIPVEQPPLQITFFAKFKILFQKIFSGEFFKNIPENTQTYWLQILLTLTGLGLLIWAGTNKKGKKRRKKR